MQHHAEKLIEKALFYTFPIYLVGGLYVSGSVLGWVLAAFALIAWRELNIHPIVLLWIAAMLVMELALLIGHIQFEFGLMSTIKSSIGWAKGWALIALFILAGALLRTPDVLYRGACQIAVAGLLVTPVLLAAGFAGIPEVLFISPLKVVGGSGPEFFEVRLYEADAGFGLPRLKYFAPWAPAIGFVCNILLLLALNEKDRVWRYLGVAGCLVMIVFSLSRLGWLVAVFVPALVFAIKYVREPKLWFAATAALYVIGLNAVPILHGVETFFDNLMSARADSTLVRAWLEDIALQRWASEAPVWGHGRVESGPHLVQFMPIGSHHTWLGLLFVKGIVGAIALGVPLAATVLYLGVRAFSSDVARTAFGVILIISLYTFGENLEILAYLYWPGLLMVGHALSREGVTVEDYR